MKKPGKEKDTGKVFVTRRVAFREAKRDHGVPVSKQPYKVVKPNTPSGDQHKLDNRNRMLYIFRILISLFGFRDTEEREIPIREDKEAFYAKKDKQMERLQCRGERRQIEKTLLLQKKMIDLLHIASLAEEEPYYLLSGISNREREGIKGISVIQLKIIEPDFDSMINEELEFPKLLEISIGTLQSIHKVFAVFAELSPKREASLDLTKACFMD